MPLSLTSGVWTAAIGLLGAGLLVIAPDAQWIGWALIASAFFVFVWGITWNGRPWWSRAKRHSSSDLEFRSTLLRIDLPPGHSVGGIMWQKGFSHVEFVLKNAGAVALNAVDIMIRLDRPILAAKAHYQLGDCVIAAQAQMPTIIAIGRDEDGNKVAIQGEREGGFTLGAPYRLLCDRFVSGSEIKIDIATVEMPKIGIEPIFTGVRNDPAYIEFGGFYDIEGERREVNGRLVFDLADGANLLAGSAGGAGLGPGGGGGGAAGGGGGGGGGIGSGGGGGGGARILPDGTVIGPGNGGDGGGSHVGGKGGAAGSVHPQGSKRDVDFELIYPARSDGSAFVGNAVQGTARIIAGGKNHIISDNEFGPNAQTLKWPPVPKNEAERRKIVFDEIFAEWVRLPGNVDLLPFPTDEALYLKTRAYINIQLGKRGEKWRLDETTCKDVGLKK